MHQSIPRGGRPLERGRLLADRYRLDEPLGSGGAGEVWRATDDVLGRDVAIKLLHGNLVRDPETVERFRREAVAAAALTHPHVVVTHDIREEDDAVYLVMEYVDGPTLADIIDTHGPLAPDVVAAIGHQVATALGAAHEKSLVHRDVKPANVLVNRIGVAKVADFGIARAVNRAQTRLTTPGKVVGTVGYVAPEQLAEGRADARADVYALGLVLFECLTGETPFRAETPQAVAAARLAREVPSPQEWRPDLPPELTDVVVRATRRDPDARYPDGRSLAVALADLAADVERDAVAALVTGATTGGRRDRTARLSAESAPTTRLSERGAATREQRSAAEATEAIAGPTPAGRDGDRRSPARTAAGQGGPAAGGRSAPTSAEAGVTARGQGTSGGAGSAAGAATAGAGTATEPAARPGAGGRISGWVRDRWEALAGLALLAVVVAAVALTAGSTGPGQGDGDGGGEAEPVAVAAASDFDPFGGGDEHADEVPHAHDGDPSTAWTTERYSSANLGNLKSGVGIWFDLGETVSVRRVELDLAAAGIDFAVYAMDEQPTGDSDAWGDPVARVEGAPAEATIALEEAAAGRYWLVWITSVGDSGRAGIADVRFFGG